MSQLNIAGQVLYADTTPAAQASVKIVEIDGLEGGVNDQIFTRTTNAGGRFSGLTEEWQDREGVFFGQNVPDVLQLRFTAKVDGKTHQGPFILLGGQSAPIILPWNPPKPVSKAQRELVQIILVSQNYDGAERALYEFIETATEALTRTTLGGQYRKVTFLKGSAATLAGFAKALDTAAGPGVDAVDVIFTTHGRTNAMEFAEGHQSKAALKGALLALPAATRKRLRTVFSTACYGATHLDAWIDGGFSDASGSVGIYADSAVSYAPFLSAWASGKTFVEAVAAANAADLNNMTDNLARAYYTATGDRSRAAQVDSDRKRAGTGATRIYSTP